MTMRAPPSLLAVVEETDEAMAGKLEEYETKVDELSWALQEAESALQEVSQVYCFRWTSIIRPLSLYFRLNKRCNRG